MNKVRTACELHASWKVACEVPLGGCRPQKMGAVRGSGAHRGGFWTMSMPSGWATSTTASPYPMNRCLSSNPPVACTLYGRQPSFNPDASTVVLHVFHAVGKAHSKEQAARLRGLLVLHLACDCLSARLSVVQDLHASSCCQTPWSSSHHGHKNHRSG